MIQVVMDVHVYGYRTGGWVSAGLRTTASYQIRNDFVPYTSSCL